MREIRLPVSDWLLHVVDAEKYDRSMDGLPQGTLLSIEVYSAFEPEHTRFKTEQ
jgi:hypothetical protein